MNKRGQLQLSFGMIFSIFLMVVFVAVAIYAINAFLGMQCDVETGAFIRDLENQINELWISSGGGDFNFENKLCSKINYVCFYDVARDITGEYSDIARTFKEQTDESGKTHNFYFYPQKGANIPSVYIKHINIEELSKNPLCIKKVNDKISIKLEKERDESLVRVGD